MPRRHLGWRSFVGALALISVLGVFGATVLRSNLDQSRSASFTQVAPTARLAGALGSTLVSVATQELLLLSRGPAFASGSGAEAQDFVAGIEPAGLGFTAGLLWLDRSGVVAARAGDASFDASGLDRSRLVEDALDGRPGAEVVGPRDGAMRFIGFARPTLGADLAVNGVLVGLSRLDATSEDQVRGLFGTSSVLVLDRDGEVVLGGAQARRTGLDIARRAAASAGAGDAGIFPDLGGSVVGWSRLPAADWLIVVERPRSELFSTAETQFERSLLLLVALCALSAAGAAFAAWRLDRVHGRETRGRRLFQTVIEELPVGVAAVDDGSRVVVANQRARDALGPDGADALVPVAEAMRTRAVVEDDVLVDADRTLAVRAAPVEVDGRVLGATVTIEDVTEDRRRTARDELLAELTARLAVAADRVEVASAVADGVAAYGADRGVVMLRDLNAADRLILASSAGFETSDVDGWEVLDVASQTPLAEAVRTGREVFLTRSDPIDRYRAAVEALRASTNEAWAALPLHSAGRVDGVLGLSFVSASDVTPAARAQLVGLAAQVSQALDRAGRQRIEHDVALGLQRGLLQPPAVEVTGLEVVSRYEPAAHHLQVGGDFFDVLPLADGSVMVVIGDVVGHGIDAASAMGQLRSAVRAVSATTCSPAEVLALLDRFAALVPPCAFATAAIVVISADRRSLRYSLAGHPPPVWVDAEGGSGFLDGALSRPLGLVGPTSVGGPTSRPETQQEVSTGFTVCLYTDGLIERRGEVIDRGLEAVLATVEAHRSASCDELADVLLDEVGAAGHHRDDIAIVCARI